MGSDRDINKRSASENESTNGKRKIALNRKELLRAYRHLIKQFELLNHNGAYDAIISDLLNRLTQLSGSGSRPPANDLAKRRNSKKE